MATVVYIAYWGGGVKYINFKHKSAISFMHLSCLYLTSKSLDS